MYISNSSIICIACLCPVIGAYAGYKMAGKLASNFIDLFSKKTDADESTECMRVIYTDYNIVGKKTIFDYDISHISKEQEIISKYSFLGGILGCMAGTFGIFHVFDMIDYL